MLLINSLYVREVRAPVAVSNSFADAILSSTAVRPCLAVGEKRRVRRATRRHLHQTGTPCLKGIGAGGNGHKAREECIYLGSACHTDSLPR
mmetsp:Transcript_33421/g.59207  ORF Transcript_33421/g.59207 Transcript_33421/m.59207 type:complete len:91 (+) Transcript_33421:613-885(+)